MNIKSFEHAQEVLLDGKAKEELRCDAAYYIFDNALPDNYSLLKSNTKDVLEKEFSVQWWMLRTLMSLCYPEIVEDRPLDISKIDFDSCWM